MKLNQFSISVSADEIAECVQTAVARARASNAQIPPELADLALEISGGHLVISTKKKFGFMPVTLSAKLGLRPAADANGIVVTLAKISAGFVGSETIAAQLMSQIGRSLTGVPGCTVSGNDITFTKETLAAKLPWLSIPGKISRFGIENDTLEITIG